MSECDCGQSGDWTACIDGFVYGPCEHEACGGVCEVQGECDCPCHGSDLQETYPGSGIYE